MNIKQNRTSILPLVCCMLLVQGCVSTIFPPKTITSKRQESNILLSEEERVLPHHPGCIDELQSLKVLSPDDYVRLMSSFKKLSKLNQLYNSVEFNATPDSVAIMRMTIESKSKLLCQRVKHASVMSVNNYISEVDIK